MSQAYAFLPACADQVSHSTFLLSSLSCLFILPSFCFTQKNRFNNERLQGAQARLGLLSSPQKLETRLLNGELRDQSPVRETRPVAAAVDRVENSPRRMPATRAAQGTQVASEVVLPNGWPKTSPSRVSVQPTTTPMPTLPFSRPLPSQSARTSHGPDGALREQPTAGPSTPQRLQASSQRERGPAVDEGGSAGEERSEAQSSLHHANEECDFNIFTGEPRKSGSFPGANFLPSVVSQSFYTIVCQPHPSMPSRT